MTSGLKLNEESVEKKLLSVVNTQDSIQSLSLWILHHKSNHKKIVEVWLKVLKKVKEHDKRLTLFNLCNDVIQTCRRKHATIYMDTFKEALPDSVTVLKEKSIRTSIERILNIWNERGIYSAEFVQGLIATLNTKTSEEQEIEYKPQKAAELLKSLNDAQADLDLKLQQMKTNVNLDVTKTDALSSVKDKTLGRKFAIQYELSCIKLDDAVFSLTQVTDERRALLELLDKAVEFYDEQFGDARIVANAYKVFGNKLNNLFRKLEELRQSLPDPLSPVPSPSADAPSPGSTPPIIAECFDDNISMDMEIESDHEGRRGHDSGSSNHSSKSLKQKTSIEQDTALSADSSALEKRIANMLPNMPLGLTQTDYPWDSSSASGLVYNPVPKSDSQTTKTDQDDSEEKDDGGSTPVMDETPIREAPFDMLSRLINKTHSNPVSGSPTTNFLESLGVVSGSKSSDEISQTKTVTTEKSWSNWKAQQASANEESQYDIDERYDNKDDTYTLRIYDPAESLSKGIPPMLPPPVTPLVPTVVPLIHAEAAPMSSFLPPDDDLGHPPSIVPTGIHDTNPFDESLSPAMTFAYEERQLPQKTGLLPTPGLSLVQPEAWEEREHFPSPKTPESIQPSIPIYLPPRQSPIPSNVPYGPRLPPSLARISGPHPQPHVYVPLSASYLPMTPNEQIPRPTVSSINQGQPSNLNTFPLQTLPPSHLPTSQYSLSLSRWSDQSTNLMSGAIGESSVHGEPVSAHRESTPPRRDYSPPHRQSPPRGYSPSPPRDSDRYRRYSRSSPEPLRSTYSPHEPVSSSYPMADSDHSHTTEVSTNYIPPLLPELQTSKFSSSLENKTTFKSDLSPMYKPPVDNSAVVAKAQLEFIEKLKRKTKTSEEDHATSLEKILSKTKNVLNKLHTTKDDPKTTVEQEKPVEIEKPIYSEPRSVPPQSTVEIMTPSEKKKPKLLSAISLPAAESKRLDNPSTREEDWRRAPLVRDFRPKSGNNRDERTPENDRYDRYKEEYYDYYYKQVASYKDNKPPLSQTKRYDRNYDSRRGNWRY